MPVKVGNVVEGTVASITNFGAFIQLPGGETGLVHISEISEDYVKKVSDYLKKNQKVMVKVLAVDDDGKISLSIRQAKPKKKSSTQPIEIDWMNRSNQKHQKLSFEEKISKFLKESSERQEQLKTRETKRSNGFKNRTISR